MSTLCTLGHCTHAHTHTHTHSFHFLARSPSPSSNFEFQHFSLIEQPSPEGAPYHPQGGINIAFGGFASDSEFQDEASSFSTLPTSQFALKPSSSDVECDTGDWGSDSMDWNWTEPVRPNSSEESGTNSQELHQRNFKRTTKVDQSPPANKSLRSSTHLLSANAPANTRHNAQKQVEQPKQPADKSRTSLSVTDSKTIVLSNSTSADSQPPSKSGSGTGNSSVQKPNETLRPSVVAEATVAAESKNRDKFLPNGPTAESVTAASAAKVDKEKTVDVWSMNGPATTIKQLNFPQKRPRENASTNRKCLFATVDAALLITSQFQLQRKRDESVISLPTQPPTAMIASGSPQPKIVNASRDMHSATINPPVKIDPLPGILQSGPPTPNNPPVKIDSLPGRISLPTIRRASTNTNGNNYPDLLQSATRRLSETERGLKQALAG